MVFSRSHGWENERWWAVFAIGESGFSGEQESNKVLRGRKTKRNYFRTRLSSSRDNAKRNYLKMRSKGHQYYGTANENVSSRVDYSIARRKRGHTRGVSSDDGRRGPRHGKNAAATTVTVRLEDATEELVAAYKGEWGEPETPSDEIALDVAPEKTESGKSSSSPRTPEKNLIGHVSYARGEKGRVSGRLAPPLSGSFVYEGAFLNGRCHGAGRETYEYNTNNNVSASAMMGFSQQKEFSQKSAGGIFSEEAEKTAEESSSREGGARNNDEDDWELPGSAPVWFEGQFVDGVKSGRGELHFVGGARYEGEFRENKYHGEGLYVWSQISHEDGVGIKKNSSVEEDSPVKKGASSVENSPVKNSTKRSFFSPSKKSRKGSSGSAQSVQSCGSVERQSGDDKFRSVEREKNIPSRGSFDEKYSMSAAAHPLSYRGQFFEGKMHGYGQVTLADGSAFEGLYEHGVKHGPGVFRWASHEQLVGRWVRGKVEGPATWFHFADKVGEGGSSSSRNTINGRGGSGGASSSSSSSGVSSGGSRFSSGGVEDSEGRSPASPVEDRLRFVRGRPVGAGEDLFAQGKALVSL